MKPLFSDLNISWGIREGSHIFSISLTQNFSAFRTIPFVSGGFRDLYVRPTTPSDSQYDFIYDKKFSHEFRNKQRQKMWSKQKSIFFCEKLFFGLMRK